MGGRERAIDTEIFKSETFKTLSVEMVSAIPTDRKMTAFIIKAKRTNAKQPKIVNSFLIRYSLLIQKSVVELVE
jgi:hypothetical protein